MIEPDKALAQLQAQSYAAMKRDQGALLQIVKAHLRGGQTPRDILTLARSQPALVAAEMYAVACHVAANPALLAEANQA